MQLGHFGSKNDYHHNSGSILKYYLKFFTMKGAKRYVEIILMVFPKKILRGKWAILEPKMAHGYNSGSALKNFF